MDNFSERLTKLKKRIKNMPVEKIKQVNKNNFNEKCLKDCLSKYLNLLKDYKQKYNLNMSLAIDYPILYMYLYVFNNQIYLRNSPQSPISKNSPNNFFSLFGLPCNPESDNTNELLISLFKILKFRRVLPYFNKVELYKSRYNIDSLPFLDAPEEYFGLIDDNLFNKQKNLSITDSEVCLLFKENLLPLPNYKERKDLFRAIYKFAKEANKNLSHHDNPYYIRYIHRGKNYIFEYCTDSKSFRLLENLVDGYPKLIPLRNKIAFSPNYVPIKFSNLLYYLTDANLSDINKFAELFAYIYASKNLCKKLTVIYAPESMKKVICQLLFDITEGRVSYFSLRSMCSSKNIKKLLDNKLQGTLLNISNESILPDISQVVTFRKLINSTEISASNAFLGCKKYVNNLHLIYLTSSQDKLKSLSKYYKINLIHIKDLSSHRTIPDINFNLDDQELTWIKNTFALYGLMLIANQNFCIKEPRSISTKKVSKKENINPIDLFISSCCTISSESECYANELHDSYCKFIEVAYGGIPLTRIAFVKTLKASGKFDYFRPHHTKNDNRYAFAGISTNSQSLEQTLLQYKNSLKLNDENTDFIRTEKIKEYLLKVNNCVKNKNDV